MEFKDPSIRSQSGYYSFAGKYSGEWISLENIAGCRLTRKTMACLEYGLVNECLKLMGSDDECARQKAEVRADLALMAVGLLRFEPGRGMVKTSGFLSRLRFWQIEQACALIQLQPDELCQEALWRVDALPESLVEDTLSRTLRVSPGAPAELPVTLCDFWNTGLFSENKITAARLLECRSRAVEWVDKRCSNDPRVMLAYLRTLYIHLRERPEAAAVYVLFKRLEDAVALWKQGYLLGEEFFRIDESVESGMRTGLQVMVQHLYGIQRNPDFPWSEMIKESSLGIVWQHEGDQQS